MGGVVTDLEIKGLISMTRISSYFARDLKQPVDKEYELAVRTGLRIPQPSLHDFPKFFRRNLLESLILAQCV